MHPDQLDALSLNVSKMRDSTRYCCLQIVESHQMHVAQGNPGRHSNGFQTRFGGEKGLASADDIVHELELTGHTSVDCCLSLTEVIGSSNTVEDFHSMSGNDGNAGFYPPDVRLSAQPLPTEECHPGSQLPGLWPKLCLLVSNIDALVFFSMALIMGVGYGTITGYLFLYLDHLGAGEALMGITLMVSHHRIDE